MDFPTIVYRCPGANPGPGGKSYDYKGVSDAKSLDVALGDGWHGSLLAACGLDSPVVPAPVADDAANDDAPPSRAELEAQALKMGLKFHGNVSDAKLARMIAEAV